MENMFAKDLFKKLKKREVQEISNSKIEKDSPLEQLMSAFSSLDVDNFYREEIFFEKVKMRYSAADIRSFLLLLPELEKNIADPNSGFYTTLGEFLDTA